MNSLSIVIPCYIKNSELLDLTKSTLFSFMRADIPEDTEVIIVDDASPLGGGYLKEEATTYIRHAENEGFVKSVNDGIRVARGDIIAVANNDIRVAPNFYLAAREIFAHNEGVYSVHPRMCFYDEPMELGDKLYLTGRERWCQTSFFLIKNKGFLFPEHFKGTGGAYEDWYLWSDVRRSGYYTAYTTRTCFQHNDSSTTKVVGEQSKAHTENAKLFKREFGDTPEEYFSKLYPDQMAIPWREEFTKI